MSKFKKLFAGATVIALATTQAMSAIVYGATGLSDPEFTNSLEWMYNNNLTKYNTEDGYRPYDYLTREQASKFYSEYAKSELGLTPDTTKDCAFSDLDSADETLKVSIVESCQLGLFKGSDGKFMPTAPLTKAAALTVLVRALDGAQDENVEPWWENYFNKARELGLTKETDVMAIDREVSRYEVALMLYRSSDASSEDAGSSEDLGDLLSGLLGDDTADDTTTDTTDDTTTDTTTDTTDDTTDTTDDTAAVEGGVLEVALNPNTPQYQRLPKGADGVTVASFDFTAGDADVQLDSLTVKRIGDGAANGVSSAAIYGPDGRASKTKSFNSSDDDAILYFSPSLVVKAGETVTLKVVASIGSTQGAQFAIQLTAVGGSVELASDLPITANVMEVGTTTATPLQLTSTGSITNPKLGTKQAEVAKFKLKNNTSNNEDVVIKSITLREQGTADEEEDLMNFALTVNGSQIATVERTSGKYLTFNLGDGVTLKEGKTEEFKVFADVIGGANKTINFEVERALDIDALGSKYGAVDVSISDNTSLQSLTIQAGELSLVFTDPASTEVRKDKDDIILGKVKVTSNAGKALELQRFTATITRSTGSSNLSSILENVELYDETSGTVFDLSCTGTTTLTCSDTTLNIALIDGGDKVFAIRADTQNTSSVGGMGFYLSFSTSSNGFYVVETDDDTQVTDITPSSNTFKTITGKSSSATLNMIPLSSTKNAVIGSKDVEAINFEIEADDSSALTVDEITVTQVGGTATFDNTTFSEFNLYKDSISEANLLKRKPGSQAASSAITFDGFSVTVPKNSKVKFIVTATITDDSNLNGKTSQLGISSTGNVSIEDEDNDDVVLTSTGASARTITVRGVGSLALDVDNSDSLTSKAKNVLANSTSDYVASYEATATNEGVVIKDVVVAADETGETVAFETAVGEVILLKADGTEIARKSVTSDSTTFDNINYTVKEGAENIYVKVVARKIGKGEAGSVTSNGYELEMRVTDAEGAESNKAVTITSIDGDGEVGDSNTFYVTPTRISNVAFVSSAGGKSVVNKLTNGENIVAILQVTTDTSTNTDGTDGSSLDTVIRQLNFSVESDATMSANTVTVERINGPGSDDNYASTHSANPTSASTVTTDLTSVSSENNKIGGGSTAYFAIKATVSGLTDSTQKYVQVSLANLDNGSTITYSSDDAGLADSADTSYISGATDALEITASTIGGLRMSFDSITADKVTQ